MYTISSRHVREIRRQRPLSPHPAQLCAPLLFCREKERKRGGVREKERGVERKREIIG